jgi:Flp pilus assembly protein CpaB
MKTRGDSALAGNGARLGAGPDGLRVEPPLTSGRRRLPELVLGIFLVAGCALGAVLLAASGRERTPVLVLGNDVARGQVIAPDDLETVYVGSDSAIAYLRSSEDDQVLGRVAVTDMKSGTILTAEQFAAPAEVLAGGDGAVGLAIEASEMPSVGLVPGDVVDVVAQDPASGTGSVAVDNAQVVAIEELSASAGESNRWWVTIRSGQDDALGLAQATVGDAPVQIVLVGR